MLSARCSKMKLIPLVLCAITFGQLAESAKLSDLYKDGKSKSSSSSHNAHPSNQGQTGRKTAEFHQTRLLGIPSSSNFAEIRGSKALVDKTFFLDEWMNHRPKHWFITAPPGSGKTSTLDMVRHFCNISAQVVNGYLEIHERTKTPTYELFRGTNMFAVKDFFNEHFQKYSVIYVDFAPLINATNLSSFKNCLCSVIKQMVSHYQSLVHYESLSHADVDFFKDYQKSGNSFCLYQFDAALTHGSYLAGILRKTFKKDVIVLGDAYDSVWNAHIIRDVKDSSTILSYFKLFVGLLIGDENHPNPEGIIPVKSLFTGLICPTKDLGSRELSMFSPILEDSVPQSPPAPSVISHNHYSEDQHTAKFFAFTKQEVKTLLAHYSADNQFSSLKDWFGSHPVIESELMLFNPRAVLALIQRPDAKPKDGLLSSPATEILAGLKKLFADPNFGAKVTECAYGGRAILGFGLAGETSLGLEDVLNLKEVAKKNPSTDVALEPLVSFFEVLQGLGLVVFGIVRGGQLHEVEPVCRASATILRDCLYESGFVGRYMGVRAEYELSLINAIADLTPTPSSINNLRGSLQSILDLWKSKNEPFYVHEDYFAASLIYTCSKKAAELYHKDVVVEANFPVRIPDAEAAKLKLAGKPVGRGEIDILLAWPTKRLGAVICLSDWQNNATQLHNEITVLRYFDVFESDSYFSKYGVKDKIVLGMDIPSSFKVNMVGEVQGANGTKLNFNSLKGKEMWVQ